MSPVRGVGAGSRREAARPGWFCAGRGYIRGASLQHRALAGVAAQERLMCCSQRAGSKLHFYPPLEGLEEPGSVQAGAAESLALPASVAAFHFGSEEQSLITCLLRPHVTRSR